jgi:uncharacterized protein
MASGRAAAPSAPAALGVRLRRLDWDAIERALWTDGWALTPPLLTPDECGSLIGLWDDANRFRSRVEMSRHRFGEGEYRYFAPPLPRLVQTLRSAAYARLAPIADRWMEALGRRERFPGRLPDFLARCAAQGQTKPTPLLLRYEAGGYNRLHRDLYGDIAFPFQLTGFLARPEVDYGGGEFLLLEQRARCQSRCEVVHGRQGELLVFATADRPAPGPRGPVRVNMRHGVSRVTWGRRWALGVIFHDAR